MSSSPRPDHFLAIDWGTTNRRIFEIANGVVVSEQRDEQGVRALEAGQYDQALASTRARFGQLPILMAGMIGSTRGMVDAGYCPTPVRLGDLAARLVQVAENAWIVPGASHSDTAHGDVMRGEEVQFLGAMRVGALPPNALLCQPGTHCKWAQLVDDAIASFETAMTGEMFDLLRTHALIAPQLQGEIKPGSAFREGVAAARGGDLLGGLFGVRADALLKRRPANQMASYASGLLIGADCVAHATHTVVTVLADNRLGPLYATALDELGITSRNIDSQAAFVAGIVAIRELSR